MVPKTAPPGWGSTYIALIPATLELPKLKRFNFKALNPKTRNPTGPIFSNLYRNYLQIPEKNP